MSIEEPKPRRTSGWTYPGVFVLTTGIFMLVMLTDVLMNRKVSQISDIGILVVTIIASLKVRINDRSSAIWAPPIVWLVALESVGQLADKSGNTLVRKQILHVAYGLANHAFWIIGSVLLAIVITWMRRAARP